MSVSTVLFGTAPNGKNVDKIMLENKNGMKASIVTFGATLLELFCPDKNGELADILVGLDSMEGFLNYWDYQGAVVAPVANRIGNGGFTLDGKFYKLNSNKAGDVTLHSCGEMTYAVWDYETVGENGVKLSLSHADGTNGFPGNIDITVTYTLEDDNKLHIAYTAISDKKTIINPTNHAYFNLAGFDGTAEEMLSHLLQLNCSRFVPVDKFSVPTGEIMNVEGTPFDFRSPKEIGMEINTENEQLKNTSGYDHNFCVDNWDKTLRTAAVAYLPSTGRCLEVITDLPGVQFYAGNFLKGLPGKENKPMSYRCGFCLETQYYPDTINHPNFPQNVLEANTPFETETILALSIK